MATSSAFSLLYLCVTWASFGRHTPPYALPTPRAPLLPLEHLLRCLVQGHDSIVSFSVFRIVNPLRFI